MWICICKVDLSLLVYSISYLFIDFEYFLLVIKEINIFFLYYNGMIMIFIFFRFFSFRKLSEDFFFSFDRLVMILRDLVKCFCESFDFFFC